MPNLLTPDPHQVLNKLGYCMLDFPYIQLFHSNDRHRCTDLVLAIHHSYLVDATSKDYIGQGGLMLPVVGTC